MDVQLQSSKKMEKGIDWLIKKIDTPLGRSTLGYEQYLGGRATTRVGKFPFVCPINGRGAKLNNR